MNRDDLQPYLGRNVTVTVDRPLGSRHPRHADMCYPLNYGYLAGTSAADGEPIDAYVLGVNEPVATFSGVVIALVLRANDVEDKLVVAPGGCHFSASEIRRIVEFQERYFQSRVELFADPTFPVQASDQASSRP